MSAELENSDDFAYLERCLQAVRGGLARYSRELRQPLLFGRSDLDRVAYLLIGADPMPPQLWIHTGVDRTRRELAIAQAVAALVVLLLEPAADDLFAQQRWSKVLVHLQHDPTRPRVVTLGAPPPVTPRAPAPKGSSNAADAGALRVQWIQSDGIRPVSLDLPLTPKTELADKHAKEPAARMIGALLKPRARVCWGVAGKSGGLVAVIDPEQLKAKTAFLDAIADAAPCGNGELALRRCILGMCRPRNHLTGDALLMLGVPEGSSQVQLVAAGGLWRVARRVLDQVQYEVALEFVWALAANRGVYRKHLAEVAGRGLAEELDRVCLESTRGGRAASVVARIFGKSQIEYEWAGMELVAGEFRRRCKKSRGGVPFGGVDLRITKPKLYDE